MNLPLKYLLAGLVLLAGCQDKHLERWKSQKWTIESNWGTWTNATEPIQRGEVLEFRDSQGKCVDIKCEYKAVRECVCEP